MTDANDVMTVAANFSIKARISRKPGLNISIG
jgi:hypothetical protein